MRKRCKNSFLVRKYLRFRRVVRALDVTDILSALEHPEREAGQKVSSGEQASRRSQREPGVLLQEFTDFLQLWYTMRLEDLLVLQHLEDSSILHAGVLRYQVDERVEHA